MFHKSLILMIAFLSFSSTLLAKNSPEESSWWGASIGQINVFSGSELKSNLYGIEYRFKSVSKWNLVPSLGFQWSDAGFNYIYSDLRYPIELGERWLLNINSGIGLYDESSQINLGHDVEFRSGFEFVFKLNEKQRLALAANHYSNSKLADRNPGTEAITLGYLHSF